MVPYRVRSGGILRVWGKSCLSLMAIAIAYSTHVGSSTARAVANLT